MMRWRGARGWSLLLLWTGKRLDPRGADCRSGRNSDAPRRAASGCALHRHALRDRCTEHEEAGLAQCARSDNRVAAGSAFAFHAKHQRGDRAVLVGAEWFGLALAMPSGAEPPR